jgi:hypothetical protein
VPGDLEQLREGALGWVQRNAGYLDSPAGRAELPPVARAKALLQLAMLHRDWARVSPADPGLAEVGALVRRVWERPELPDAFTADPRYVRQYSLMYCGLAPAATAPRREILGRLASDGYLSTASGSPYLRLEIAYYADMAGIRHPMGSYPQLYAASLLAGRATALPITDAEACTIAHTIFYLCDYGLRPSALDGGSLQRARRIAVELTWHYIRRDGWDNVAKFVLAQFCLGLDPARTPSGAAGIQLLARIQEASGAMPGAAIGQVPGQEATWTQRFRTSYQTTLMAAVMSLMISADRA